MSSQHEVAQKHALVSQLLKRDKFMSPVEVMKAVTKKFGTGISRVDIARIRMNDHGIKLGPGGYAHSKSGQRVKETPAAPTPPNGTNTAALASADRLSKLIGELQAEMKMQHVSTLTIPVTGPVEAVQTVRRTIAVSA